MKPLHLIGSEMADKPDVFVSLGDQQLHLLAMIEAMRASRDASDRLAKTVENQGVQLVEIGKHLGNIDTRLGVIESGTLGQWVEAIDKRLAVVEADQLRRQGREGVWAAIMRSPLVAWFITLGSVVAGAWAIFREGGQ